MVERGGFEIRCTCKGTQGSNPCLSATFEAWEARLAGNSQDAEARYEAARDLARARGFRYLDAGAVAKLPVEDVVERVEAIPAPANKPDVVEAAALLGKTLDAIEAFSGRRPRSWESPGLTETDETLDLLRKHGVEYVADWVIDDLPQEIETPYGDITTIPYTVETNDITVFALQGHESDVFLKRGCDQFDRLYAKGAENSRVMAISIQPYITGVPHRIRYLEELLDHVGGHDGMAWMTAREIGDWYRLQMRAHRGRTSES